jgi:hypothetical protein
MPRIIITNDTSSREDPVVLLDEQVHLAELSEDHGALRFIERLGWAISDAEDQATVRIAGSHRSSPTPRAPRRRGSQPQRASTTRRRARSAVASLLPRPTS